MVTHDRSRREKSRSPIRGGVALSAAISLGSSLLALVLVVLQIRYSHRIADLGLAAGLYFIEAALIGLAASSILFGVLSSTGHFEASKSGFKVKFTGAAAVFGFVLWLGVHFAPEVLPFTFTIYLHGPAGRQDIILRGKGEVDIDTGSLRSKRPIDPDGDAIFLEIPANFLGKEVPVLLEADGFELAEPNATVRLVNGGAYVEVRRKPGLIRGYVEDEQRRPLSGVTLALAGMTRSSDNSGNFEFVVPGEKIQAQLTLTAESPGFHEYRDMVYVNSNDLTIMLSRQR